MAFDQIQPRDAAGQFAAKTGSPAEFSLTGQQSAQDARRRQVAELRTQAEERAVLYAADATVRNEDAMLSAEYRVQEAIIERDRMDVETLGALTDALRIIEVVNASGGTGVPDAPVSGPDLAQRFGETATRKAGERMTALTRLANQRPELRELSLTSRTTADTRELVVRGQAEKLHGGFELADLVFDARAVGGPRLARQAQRQAVEALYEDEAGFVEDFRQAHFAGHEHTIERERREALGNVRHASYFETWA